MILKVKTQLETLFIKQVEDDTFVVWSSLGGRVREIGREEFEKLVNDVDIETGELVKEINTKERIL